MKRGWGLQIGETRWHYFVGATALCGARKHDWTRLYKVRPDLRLCYVCERGEQIAARRA